MSIPYHMFSNVHVPEEISVSSRYVVFWAIFNRILSKDNRIAINGWLVFFYWSHSWRDHQKCSSSFGTLLQIHVIVVFNQVFGACLARCDDNFWDKLDHICFHTWALRNNFQNFNAVFLHDIGKNPLKISLAQLQRLAGVLGLFVVFRFEIYKWKHGLINEYLNKELIEWGSSSLLCNTRSCSPTSQTSSQSYTWHYSPKIIFIKIWLLTYNVNLSCVYRISLSNIKVMKMWS